MQSRIVVALAVLAPAPQELFRLAVDPGAPTPIYDATGRHALVPGGVADIDPDAPVVPGSVIATTVTAPNGANAALFAGGWLEITHQDPAFADDVTLHETGRRVISFWFKSPGNGAYAASGFEDRMHALGFGVENDNLDVDFGDSDHVGAFGETACWTYWNGPGNNYVIDFDTSRDRNYYLDDDWHFYRLVRDGELISVKIDDDELGFTLYSGAINDAAGPSFIGRCSGFPFPGDPLPWFGYIASFSIVEDAEAPVIAAPSSVLKLDRKGPPGEVVFFTVTASDDIDPAPSVECVPPSGSFFPLGTTMVTCTATDASGNQSAVVFPVVVRVPYRNERP